MPQRVLGYYLINTFFVISAIFVVNSDVFNLTTQGHKILCPYNVVNLITNG
jgi:hypothetical protein